MNVAEGETKGITSTTLFFFPSRCTAALGQKQIHLEILLLGLCWAAWSLSMKNQPDIEEITQVCFYLGRHDIGSEMPSGLRRFLKQNKVIKLKQDISLLFFLLFDLYLCSLERINKLG